MAQLVEWLSSNRKVNGSTPPPPFSHCSSVLEQDTKTQIAAAELVGTLHGSLSYQCVNGSVRYYIVMRFGQKLYKWSIYHFPNSYKAIEPLTSNSENHRVQ